MTISLPRSGFLYRGRVNLSPEVMGEAAYWIGCEIVLSRDKIYIIRGDRVLLSIPYEYLYSAERVHGAPDAPLVIRYIDPEKMFESIHVSGSMVLERYIEKIVSRLTSRQYNDIIPRDSHVIYWKILFLLFKKVPFKVISQLLDIDLKDLSRILNNLKRLGYIDSRGYPTSKGYKLVASIVKTI